MSASRLCPQCSAGKAAHWTTLGAALYRAGDLATCLRALERAMEMEGGGDARDLYFAAMALHRLGKGDKARALYERAVQWVGEHRPDDAELQRLGNEAARLLGIG